MPKIAIHHPDDPKRPKTIPAERFDPARHTRWEEGVPLDAAAESPAAHIDPGGDDAADVQGFDALPEDFPPGQAAKTALEAYGITTVHGVRAVNDFDVIPGIGQKTEARIVAWLKDLESQDGQEEQEADE